jgi:hypothetical protein
MNQRRRRPPGAGQRVIVCGLDEGEQLLLVGCDQRCSRHGRRPARVRIPDDRDANERSRDERSDPLVGGRSVPIVRHQDRRRPREHCGGLLQYRANYPCGPAGVDPGHGVVARPDAGLHRRTAGPGQGNELHLIAKHRPDPLGRLVTGQRSDQHHRTGAPSGQAGCQRRSAGSEGLSRSGDDRHRCLGREPGSGAHDVDVQ